MDKYDELNYTLYACLCSYLAKKGVLDKQEFRKHLLDFAEQENLKAVTREMIKDTVIALDRLL